MRLWGNSKNGNDSLAARLRGARGSHKLPPTQQRMMTADEFRNELEKEMLRSDRTGDPLTVVCFTLPRGCVRRLDQLEMLAAVVAANTRRIDSRGWCRSPQGLGVGLLLFNTQPASADRIIASVRAEYQAAMASQLKEPAANGKDHCDNPKCDLICSVYGYPLENEAPTETNGQETPAEASGPAQPITAEMLLIHSLPLWKRSLDIAGALTGLVAAAPVMLLIAAGIKLTDGGPVFFVQNRVGIGGRPFRFLKFRSMYVNPDNTRHQQYLSELIRQAAQAGTGAEQPMTKLDRGDPRITPIGRLIRTTSLDELPQLVNVLRGDMSLVGPRPCLPNEARDYPRWCRRRFDAIPGITGLWQVMGKNRTTFTQMMRLDISYARQCSFWLDLKILFMTLPTVLNDVRQTLARRRAKGVQHGQQEA